MLTGDASAVLEIERLGHCTVVLADAETVAWLVAAAVAVFGYAPQLANAVALVTCTEVDAPSAMSPNEHDNVRPPIEQPAFAGLIDQLMPVPVGNGSDKVTAFAVPVPELLTVIVNPIGSPALTDAASAAFAIVRCGQLTAVLADAWTEPALVAVAVAVFGYAPQLANTVALVTCTEFDAVGAMSPNEHDNVAPTIEQPAFAGLIDQLMPVPVGSGSFSVTPVAVPAPVFDTVIVNPIGSPALTDTASAVFAICRPGHCTEVLALACTCGLFDAWALAVFG